MNKYKEFSQSKILSKEIQKFRKCIRKKRYNTEEEAFIKGQIIYKCKYCNGYHRSSSTISLAKRLNYE